MRSMHSPWTTEQLNMVTMLLKEITRCLMITIMVRHCSSIPRAIPTRSFYLKSGSFLWQSASSSKGITKLCFCMGEEVVPLIGTASCLETTNLNHWLPWVRARELTSSWTGFPMCDSKKYLLRDLGTSHHAARPTRHKFRT
jgi:hypothetical protein